MIEHGLLVRMQRAEGYWMDVGRRLDYEQANEDFSAVFGG